MRGFELDRQTGDVVISGGQIQYTEGVDLTAQNLEKLITTGRGEWWLNTQQGVNFKNILTKNPDYDLIQNEIQQALLQVDDSLVIQTFEHSVEDRRMHIEFTAKSQTDEAVRAQVAFG